MHAYVRVSRCAILRMTEVYMFMMNDERFW